MKTPRALFGIIVIAVGLRVVAAIYMGDQVVELPGTADQLSYHTLALRVLQGHGFTFDRTWWPATAAGAPTAHWSYLYTFYLMAIYSLFGPYPLIARLVQAILVGTLQPALTYWIAQRIFEPYTQRSGLVALAAASACAVYTYFVYYAAALMTEPFFIVSVLGSLYLAMQFAEQMPQPAAGKSRPLQGISKALLLGITLSVAVLLRQLYLLFIPFLFLWIGWRKRKGFLIGLVLASLIVGASIFPFTLYNYARFQRFVLLNTNAGFVLFWANHPMYGTRFIPILAPETYRGLIPPHLLSLNEAALDQALLRLGVQFILDDPVRYVLLSVSRIPIYFEFWPSKEDGLISNLARVGGFGLFLPFMAVGLLRSWGFSLRKIRSWIKWTTSPIFLLSFFLVFYTALHIFAWALIRYRLPVDAVLLSFAGLSLVELATWVAGKMNLKIPGWARLVFEGASPELKGKSTGVE